ncbi:hypothetical protein B0H14DRAFT_2574954 [Mycena olivaceomarginata]|nr:hypothetical protein B0H14DRAFT_2574954 [Mycena olivaceomarginata]
MSAFLPHAFSQYYRDSFGAGIIGCMLAMGIYGLTTSQTYFYFVEYPKDKIWLKTFVSVLWYGPPCFIPAPFRASMLYGFQALQQLTFRPHIPYGVSLPCQPKHSVPVYI